MTPGPPPAPAASHREILAVFAGLATAMFLAALDQTIVATALPTIVGELGGLSQLSWVVTAYLLASTVSVPLYGKVSDLYGRKRLFQFAIVVFVLGSAACAVAQNMGQLIAFRAIQGAGAGGLIALTQAIIGDVVSPRQRGRYMGYIGAVFGVASVLGPLLGGWFVDALDWRWVFYINIPLGAVALVVTQRKLRLRSQRRQAVVDWAGAALLTAAITALLLVTVWGGQTYAWTSPTILVLAATSVLGLAAFVFVERRAREPILPPELFADPVFTVAGALGFIVGMAMFGAIVFLPLFMQVVIGLSATSSGLLLLPLMVGLLTASITSGRLITRWGHYRPFPIAGTAVLGVGLWLLSTMTADTTQLRASVYMAVVGAGIGMVMQVLVLAVQNAVPSRHLGTATSATQLFRSTGGTIGVAAFGALLNARFAANLSGQALPNGVAALLRGGSEGLTGSPGAIAALPPAARAAVQAALADAITTVFAVAVPLAAVAFVLAVLLRERPLRTAVHDIPEGTADAIAAGAPGLVETPRAAADQARPR